MSNVKKSLVWGASLGIIFSAALAVEFQEYKFGLKLAEEIKNRHQELNLD